VVAKRSKRGTISNPDQILQGLANGRDAALGVLTQAKIHSIEYDAADAARKGIDELAHVLTGERAYFAPKAHDVLRQS
jgi:hypothetical protein